MQIRKKNWKLKQRFVLALFYFETTQAGRSSWSRCNPPIGTEDDVCNSAGDKRWLTGTDECLWHGITCHADTGLVKWIELSELDNTVLNFSCFMFLTFLLADRIYLQGTLPSALMHLSSIEALYFYSNKLSGTIPEWIYGLTELKSFNTKFSSNIY